MTGKILEIKTNYFLIPQLIINYMIESINNKSVELAK